MELTHKPGEPSRSSGQRATLTRQRVSRLKSLAVGGNKYKLIQKCVLCYMYAFDSRRTNFKNWLTRRVSEASRLPPPVIFDSLSYCSIRVRSLTHSGILVCQGPLFLQRTYIYGHPFSARWQQPMQRVFKIICRSCCHR